MWLEDPVYTITEDLSNVLEDCQTISTTLPDQLDPKDLTQQTSSEDRPSSPGPASPGYVPSDSYNSNHHEESDMPPFDELSTEQGNDFPLTSTWSSSCSIVVEPHNRLTKTSCVTESPEQSCAHLLTRVMDRELISPTHSDGGYVTVSP